MRPPQRRQPLRQLLRHFLFRLGRPRRDRRQAGRQSKEILHPMAHFAGKQLVTLFRLLTPRDIEKDARHFLSCGVCVTPQAARRNPPHF